MGKIWWTKLIIILGLALLIASLPLLAACGDDDETAEPTKTVEPTKTTEPTKTVEPTTPAAEPVDLKVGFIADFTGAAAVMSAPAANGVIDYLKYVNDEKGGIDGNPIDIDWIDCKFETSLAQNAYDRMVDENALCIVAMNSPYVKAALPYLEVDQMPLATLANNLPFVYDLSPDLPNAYIYGIGGCADEEYSSFVDYALENWTADRSIRLVLAYPDNSFGTAIKTMFPTWVEEQQGVEIVGEVIVDMNPEDATAALTNIKDHDPDYVLLRLMANGIATFLDDAEAAGMEAPIIGNYVGKPGDIENLVSSPQVLDQFMIANLFGVLEDDTWGMNLAREIGEEYQGSSLEGLGSMYWWGVGVGMVIEEALQQAVESQGAEALTSALVKEFGFDKVNNLDTGGLIGTVTITPTDHRSITQHRIIGYENGQLVVLRDWMDLVPVVDWGH